MTPEEKLNQAESTAKKALEEVAEARRMLGKAGPWRPVHCEKYYYVFHDGATWRVCCEDYVSSTTIDKARVGAGNCYRTKQEAQKEKRRRFDMSRKLDAERANDKKPLCWYYCGECDANYTVSICPRCLVSIQRLP